MSDLSWLTARPIAHRGYHDMNRQRWENTLSAFDAAIERGFAIECDVHLSKDEVPVVFHDLDLKRLTGEDGHVVRGDVLRRDDDRDTRADLLAHARVGAVKPAVEREDERDGVLRDGVRRVGGDAGHGQPVDDRHRRGTEPDLRLEHE